MVGHFSTPTAPYFQQYTEETFYSQNNYGDNTI